MGQGDERPGRYKGLGVSLKFRLGSCCVAREKALETGKREQMRTTEIGLVS